jgi:hypothetical protein
MFQFFNPVATIPETLPEKTGIAHFLNKCLTFFCLGETLPYGTGVVVVVVR